MIRPYCNALCNTIDLIDLCMIKKTQVTIKVILTFTLETSVFDRQKTREAPAKCVCVHIY